jgi:hypothetical protein
VGQSLHFGCRPPVSPPRGIQKWYYFPELSTLSGNYTVVFRAYYSYTSALVLCIFIVPEVDFVHVLIRLMRIDLVPVSWATVYPSIAVSTRLVLPPYRYPQSRPAWRRPPPAAAASLPKGWSVPEFTPVLDRLRNMTSTGTWPPTPASRGYIFLPREDDTVQEATAASSLPPPGSITLTSANAGALGLTELWHECVRLEAFLAPVGRSLPSGSVTINSHAQFRPHTDSKHGSRPSSQSAQVETESDMALSSLRQQQPTLHVGIGSYTGGALFVEGVEHDIRYTPLSYDGVSQKHWTAPFQGERYTLVWA